MVTGSMPPEFEAVRVVVVGLDPESLTEVQPVRRDRLAKAEKRRRVFMVRFGFTGFMLRR
jgi:CHASE2 domain-containing sensor protein